MKKVKKNVGNSTEMACGKLSQFQFKIIAELMQDYDSIELHQKIIEFT